MADQARSLDKQYPSHTDEFVVPTFGSLGIVSSRFHPQDPSIYFCGNSLGLMPKTTPQAVADELHAWGQRAVEAHFNHPGHQNTLWMDIDLPLVELLAPIVGAKSSEVAAMGLLTANLNALLVAFYKPSGKRTKILLEKNAFPSDYYALLNMVQMHGLDASHLVQLEVPKGETYLPTQLILDTIDSYKDELAMVLLPGIQYYTGQYFDIETITKHAQAHGIVVGWDLAHAVGNVPLFLHAWGVDFAAWCSYKYLNAGPGAIGGIYVHEKYTNANRVDGYTPRLAGWWGTKAADRFKMLETFDPIQLALSYRQSNPSVIDCVSLQSLLRVFERAGGVGQLREKSVALTGFLLRLLTESGYCLNRGSARPNPGELGFKILTPANPDERGCQLSLLFQPHHDDVAKNVMDQVHAYLHQHAIVCDERRPDVIRIAPVPLYNTFQEVATVVARLVEAMEAIGNRAE